MIFLERITHFFFRTIQHTFSINKEQYASSFKIDSCDKQIKVMGWTMRTIKRGEKKKVVQYVSSEGNEKEKNKSYTSSKEMTELEHIKAVSNMMFQNN